MDRNIIAILRGVTPDEVIGIAQILLDAGITKIEVPLNSPDPFTSISSLCTHFKGRGLFGGGTVLDEREVAALVDIGAQMIVSPNCDEAVIKAAKSAKMHSFPGVMTPSEAFRAIKAGADGLKIFPGEMVTPAGLKAMRAVLPANVQCFVVGGVNIANFAEWKAAGATGFGIGSALYKAGDSTESVRQKAVEIIKIYDSLYG
ncbi:MAG: 2-dehydro-3-deoxy-6-phosphogalactonate aldolase [Alphaproteobacteria bacterium]